MQILLLDIAFSIRIIICSVQFESHLIGWQPVAPSFYLLDVYISKTLKYSDNPRLGCIPKLSHIHRKYA